MPARPHFLSDRLTNSRRSTRRRTVTSVLDVLADILEANRTDGMVFARVRFRAPWGLRCDPAPLAGFHIVARGSCSAHLDGQPEPHHLDSGDIALITQGEGHDLYDAPSSPATPLPELIGDLEPGTIGHLTLGADTGPETILVCGGYLFRDPGPHPLLSALPPIVHLRHDEINHGTRVTIDQLLAEIADPQEGSKTVVNRLVDVLLVLVLRTWIQNRSLDELGWLAAFRDPAISAAMQRIHADYQQPLPLNELAADCGLSLSTFKKRFTQLLGEPPGNYLTRLRHDIACRHLRDTDLPVNRIAASVGYTSEYAFNRAFTRSKGMSPGRFRTHARTNPPTSPVKPAAVPTPDRTTRPRSDPPVGAGLGSPND